MSGPVMRPYTQEIIEILPSQEKFIGEVIRFEEGVGGNYLKEEELEHVV